MNGIYQGLYNLIATYIYGGEIIANSYQDLVAVNIATIGSLLVASIPFIVVGLIITMIFKVWSNFICGGR